MTDLARMWLSPADPPENSTAVPQEISNDRISTLTTAALTKARTSWPPPESRAIPVRRIGEQRMYRQAARTGDPQSSLRCEADSDGTAACAGVTSVHGGPAGAGADQQRGTGLARCSCAGGLVQRALTFRAHTVSAAARCRSSQLSLATSDLGLPDLESTMGWLAKN